MYSRFRDIGFKRGPLVEPRSNSGHGSANSCGPIDVENEKNAIEILLRESLLTDGWRIPRLYVISMGKER